MNEHITYLRLSSISTFSVSRSSIGRPVVLVLGDHLLVHFRVFKLGKGGLTEKDVLVSARINATFSADEERRAF